MPSSSGPGSIRPYIHPRRSVQSVTVLGVAGPGACFKRLKPLVMLPGSLTSKPSSTAVWSGTSRAMTRLYRRPWTSARSRLTNRSRVLNAGRSMASASRGLAHRNLLAHAPDTLHEEVSADYTDMIYAETARRRRPGNAHSCASGGCAARRWRPVWKKLATACLLSSVCPRASGNRLGPRTPSSACMRSSNDGLRSRPCCPRPKRLPCCSAQSLPRSYAGERRPGRRLRSLPSQPGAARCRTLNIRLKPPPVLILPCRST